MPICKQCGEEVDELVAVKVSGKAKKVCEDCASEFEAEGEVQDAAFDAMRGMMEYKGKR
jgi:ribosome-binding protein aMBF1 (putative translation factor)